MSSFFCPKCNYRTSQDESFCCKCGEKLISQKVFCKSCGNELVTTDQFCTKCGTRRNKTKSQSKRNHSRYNFLYVIVLAISLFLGFGCGRMVKKYGFNPTLTPNPLNNSEMTRSMPPEFNAGAYESITDLQQRAKDGDADAQYRLAECYQGRISSNIIGFIPPNKSQAVYWYQKAADQGHEGAKNALKQLGY